MKKLPENCLFFEVRIGLVNNDQSVDVFTESKLSISEEDVLNEFGGSIKRAEKKIIDLFPRLKKKK